MTKPLLPNLLRIDPKELQDGEDIWIDFYNDGMLHYVGVACGSPGIGDGFVWVVCDADGAVDTEKIHPGEVCYVARESLTPAIRKADLSK